MNKIKPIPTPYNGIWYRSKLEAKWAYFFDWCGIKHYYESEGVQLSDDTWYEPDFYLPELKTYAEIKGVMSDTDEHKILQFTKDYGGDFLIGYNDFHFQMVVNGEFLPEDCSWLCECRECGALFFMDECGCWDCRKCDHYEGNSGFEVLMYGDGNCSDEHVKHAIASAMNFRCDHGATVMPPVTTIPTMRCNDNDGKAQHKFDWSVLFE